MPTINPPDTVPQDIQKEMKETFGLVPSFMRAIPKEQAQRFWHTMRDFQLSDKTALDPKTKELIGLGVAAQIPCHYCTSFHSEAARLHGASEQEIQEAIYMAGFTRQASTILNGAEVDRNTFDKELKQIVEHLKKQGQAVTVGR